jgi:hypothetical protein
LDLKKKIELLQLENLKLRSEIDSLRKEMETLQHENMAETTELSVLNNQVSTQNEKVAPEEKIALQNSKIGLQNAQIALQKAQIALQKAQIALQKAKTDAQNAKIDAKENIVLQNAQIALENAQIAFENARIALEKTKTDAEIAKAKVKIAKAEAQIAKANTQIAKVRVQTARVEVQNATIVLQNVKIAAENVNIHENDEKFRFLYETFSRLIFKTDCIPVMYEGFLLWCAQFKNDCDAIIQDNIVDRSASDFVNVFLGRERKDDQFFDETKLPAIKKVIDSYRTVLKLPDIEQFAKFCDRVGEINVSEENRKEPARIYNEMKEKGKIDPQFLESVELYFLHAVDSVEKNKNKNAFQFFESIIDNYAKEERPRD